MLEPGRDERRRRRRHHLSQLLRMLHRHLRCVLLSNPEPERRESMNIKEE